MPETHVFLTATELAFAMARRHARALALSPDVPDHIIDKQARANLAPYLEEAEALLDEIPRLRDDPAIITPGHWRDRCMSKFEDLPVKLPVFTRQGYPEELPSDSEPKD